MKSFRHYVATPMYFGNNVVKENKKLIGSFGKRAFILTDEFLDGCRNYALEDVIEVLEEQGIEYLVNDQVEDNPSVETCVAITKIAREFKADFMFGIGGGSAIDAAKTVGFLLAQPEDVDVYAALFSGPAFFEHLYQELEKIGRAHV